MKVEGGIKVYETIKCLVNNNIPVMGHVGLLPQSVKKKSDYRVKGKDHLSFNQIIKDSISAEKAGAFSLVVECVIKDLADKINQSVNIPTIGIGASNKCDGQILVTEDLLGYSEKPPKFVKMYDNFKERTEICIKKFVKDLKNNNFFVSTAINASDAEEKLKIIKFDLAIIDIMMPGKDGLQLTKEIREKIDLPIILLTAKGEPEDRVRGLELGAEDYLPKPFEPKELLLRIKNVIKRIRKNKYVITSIKIGKASINMKKMEIQKEKKVIKINASEKILLENMIGSAGKIFSREEISKITNLTQERSIDVLVTRLRQKIEPDPKNPKYLQTVRGTGYVLWLD
ncbi:MAG: hypothetical protein RI930_418 [Pseudomonadota bacterium]